MCKFMKKNITINSLIKIEFYKLKLTKKYFLLHCILKHQKNIYLLIIQNE